MIKRLKRNLKKQQKLMKILSDDDKKARYDQYGHSAFEVVRRRWWFWWGGMDMDDIFSQFGDIFGGGGADLVACGGGQRRLELKEVICEFV